MATITLDLSRYFNDVLIDNGHTAIQDLVDGTDAVISNVTLYDDVWDDCLTDVHGTITGSYDAIAEVIRRYTHDDAILIAAYMYRIVE